MEFEGALVWGQDISNSELESYSKEELGSHSGFEEKDDGEEDLERLLSVVHFFGHILVPSKCLLYKIDHEKYKKVCRLTPRRILSSLMSIPRSTWKTRPVA